MNRLSHSSHNRSIIGPGYVLLPEIPASPETGQYFQQIYDHILNSLTSPQGQLNSRSQKRQSISHASRVEGQTTPVIEPSGAALMIVISLLMWFLLHRHAAFCSSGLRRPKAGSIHPSGYRWMSRLSRPSAGFVVGQKWIFFFFFFIMHEESLPLNPTAIGRWPERKSDLGLG